MPEIKLGARELQYIAFFEGVTGVRVRDCVAFEEDNLVIFVIDGPVRAAIGKNGSKIKLVRNYLKKNVKVVSYSDSPEVFLRNFFSQYGVRKVEIMEEKGIKRAYIYVDPTKKPGAVGKGGKNVRMAKAVVRRHFDIDDVYVVRGLLLYPLDGEIIKGHQITICELVRSIKLRKVGESKCRVAQMVSLLQER